jgi:hypothetical protein
MKQLYYHGDKMYIFNRRIKIERFKARGEVDLEFLSKFRDHIKCDHVLRDQTHFLFVNTIEEVEFENVEDNVYLEESGDTDE